MTKITKLLKKQFSAVLKDSPSHASNASLFSSMPFQLQICYKRAEKRERKSIISHTSILFSNFKVEVEESIACYL